MHSPFVKPASRRALRQYAAAVALDRCGGCARRAERRAAAFRMGARLRTARGGRAGGGDVFLDLRVEYVRGDAARSAHARNLPAFPRRLAPDGAEAVVDARDFISRFAPWPMAPKLTLRVTNTTDRASAGNCRCHSVLESRPGAGDEPVDAAAAQPGVRRSDGAGDQLLPFGGGTRAARFTRAAFQHPVPRGGRAGIRWRTFRFSNKWPTAGDDATAGLLVRASEDGLWVTGIAWADFLSVQGHNPWSCLHVGVRVGPLQPGGSRTIRGRLYLFPGTKEECVAGFRRDFPAPPQP